MGGVGSIVGGRETFDSRAQTRFTRVYKVGCLSPNSRVDPGRFGVLRCGLHRRSGKNCHVKVLAAAEPILGTNKFEKSSARYEMVNAEIQIMKKVGRHKHCVRLLDAFTDASDPLGFIVLERTGPLVKDRLASALYMLDEGFASRCINEMLLGINHLHESMVVHRTVEPGCFVLGGPQWKTVKLTDFSSAVVLPRKGLLTEPVGADGYMSPEMKTGLGYDTRTDMWSFGLTLYDLLFGDGGEQEAEERTVNGIEDLSWRKDGLVDPSDEAIELMKALLQKSPQYRVRATQALAMPFIVRFSSDRRHTEPTTAPSHRKSQEENFEFDRQVSRLTRQNSAPTPTSAARAQSGTFDTATTLGRL
eukprot:TRINITY_DN46905_c0_g1_i1.p1 TRINITY_DN46905_c0_g1~~TRINITY_DN46905_c0_g1_i1.p1  ORF type:complete len:361 (-),score=35.70 TRINITY_DN46905_c0_g1_i1:79-1161(-)